MAHSTVYTWIRPASSFGDKLFDELEHRKSHVVLAVGGYACGRTEGATDAFSEFFSKSVLGSGNVCFGWLHEGTTEGKVTVILKPRSV